MKINLPCMIESGSIRERRLYTRICNRRHSNVAFMLGESLRYETEALEASWLDLNRYINY